MTETCECGEPATVEVVHDGCKYCGGTDCGDFPEVEHLCAACAAAERAS